MFCGTRIIISHAMRTEMIARSYRSHLGILLTISTARDIMYWPRITADLTEVVQRCETCQQSKPALPKEPLMTYPIPRLPWQILASDCFECDGQHYLNQCPTVATKHKGCNSRTPVQSSGSADPSKQVTRTRPG